MISICYNIFADNASKISGRGLRFSGYPGREERMPAPGNTVKKAGGISRRPFPVPLLLSIQTGKADDLSGPQSLRLAGIVGYQDHRPPGAPAGGIRYHQGLCRRV